MPRYYCDYCDTYLTHDSPSVRKQHNAGYKHKANVRTYYQQFEEQQTQKLIDQRIKEHLGQAAVAAYSQVGAAFNQHLASMPGVPPRVRLPILPTPGMPVPVAGQPPLIAGMRPPILARPPGAPAYGTVPIMATNVAPPGAPMAQGNGLPQPPPISLPTASAGGVGAPSSNGTPSTVTPVLYQANPSAPGSTAPSAPSSLDNFAYAQAPEAGQ